jgi:hypothetical protein
MGSSGREERNSPTNLSPLIRVLRNASDSTLLLEKHLKYVVKQLTAEQNVTNTHKRAYKHAEVKGKGKYLANKQII